MILSDHNLCLSFTADMQNICRELFNNSEISYFEYTRVYSDNTGFKIDTSGDFQSYILSNDLYLTYGELKNTNRYSLLTLNSSLLIPPSPQYTELLLEARDSFGIDNMFVITKNHTEYLEVFLYASNPGNISIINYYYNNIEVLEKFCLYFKNNAHQMLEILAKKDNRLNFDKYSEDSWENYLLSQQTDSNETPYSNSMGISNRELQCVQLVLKGMTAKEIALKLNISPRTVDRHIYNIKQKLNFRTRTELKQYFSEEYNYIVK